MTPAELFAWKQHEITGGCHANRWFKLFSVWQWWKSPSLSADWQGRSGALAQDVASSRSADTTEEMARPGSGLLVPVNGLGYPPQNLARVVVWEWLNEHGRWRPYTAAVCHHIENVLKGDARGSVVLGQVDAQLSPYIIDLQSMHQFRQDTGKSVHRWHRRRCQGKHR